MPCGCRPARRSRSRASSNCCAQHAIEVLVTKASGGEATYAKLAAARVLGLPVLMVRRPAPPPGPVVETVADALEWLGAA